MKHIVLYVPGLGDHRLDGRRKLLSLWHYRGIQIEISAKEWTVDHSWEFKLKRLVATIDRLHGPNTSISLIGESAGASAVLQALRLRQDKLNAVILLCGKSQYPERVAPRLYRKNPALRDAMIGSQAVVDTLTASEKSKILNLHPLLDPIVPVWETKIPGVKNARIPSIGHATSIIVGMSLWSWRIVSFIRWRARQA